MLRAGRNYHKTEKQEANVSGKPFSSSCLVQQYPGLVQSPEVPLPSEQFTVTAALNNPALLQNTDGIYLLYRGEPVGDHQQGNAVDGYQTRNQRDKRLPAATRPTPIR